MDSENSDNTSCDSICEEYDNSNSENSDSSDAAMVSKSKRPRIENLDVAEAGSIPMAMAKTTWQQTTVTAEERDNYLLDYNMFTDVKFIVGKEGEEILCHRLHLARTSPTFAAMFYGELATNESEIKIPDVSPEAFKVLLKYVYSGSLKLKSYDLAWEILYAAKKYLMPDALLIQIQIFLRDERFRNYDCFGKPKDNITRVWPTIQLADDLAEEELLGDTWQHVEEHTSSVLKHVNFDDVSPAILETLVKKDNLNCTEDELFQACLEWATHEAMKQGYLKPEPENLREILSSILPQIRFLAFDTNAFFDGPAKLGLLTKSEIDSVVNYKIPEQVPPTICNITTQRKYQTPDHFYVIGEPVASCNRRKDDGSILPSFTYSDYTSPEKAFEEPSSKVFGFKIPSQIKKSESISYDSYVENFTAYFYQEDYSDDDLEHRWNRHAHPCYNCYNKEYEEDRVVQVKHFKSVVKYNSDIIVQFDDPSFDNEYGQLFQFGIVFHKSGCYPTQLTHVKNPITVKTDSDAEIKELECCHFMALLYCEK